MVAVSCYHEIMIIWKSVAVWGTIITYKIESNTNISYIKISAKECWITTHLSGNLTETYNSKIEESKE